MSLSTLFDATDVDARPIATNPVAATFATAARAVATWRAERARHLALTDLLGMEPHRLRDLGIDAYDVQQALQHGHSNRT